MDFRALLDGYRRFRSQNWEQTRDRWRGLAEGQSPKVMIIACCDSRADPATIFDTSPGEVFVVRNVANLVPPYEELGGRHGVSAALEFAVTQLEVHDVVIMGHGRCGGVEAALTGRFRDSPTGEGGFISRWMELLDEPCRVVADDRGDPRPAGIRLEEAAIRHSLVNLRTFPFVAQREAAALLALHGCHFSIAEGQLCLLDEAEGKFRPV